MFIFTFMFLILFFSISLILQKGLVLVRQQEAVVIEFLGQYSRILPPGIHFITPYFETKRKMMQIETRKGKDGKLYSIFKYSYRIDLRETVYDFSIENLVTKDGISVNANLVLFFRIVDPKRAVYSIENLPEAIEKLTQTNLRNLVGQLSLNETLVSRDTINDELREVLVKTTDKWGVKINRIDVQDIKSSV